MDLLDLFKNYWALIIGAVALIISYADLKSQANETQKELSELKDKIQKWNIEVTLALIQKDIQYIKEKIDSK